MPPRSWRVRIEDILEALGTDLPPLSVPPDMLGFVYCNLLRSREQGLRCSRVNFIETACTTGVESQYNKRDIERIRCHVVRRTPAAARMGARGASPSHANQEGVLL